jgi:glycosyltransferase involved in cell wall biosynthesis/transposase
VKPKLNLDQREELIKRALKGETIDRLCQEFGISRALFYRFLGRFKTKGKAALRPKNPKEEKLFHPKLTSQERIEVVERVLINHEKVKDVCARYGISRPIFYRLKKRYLLAKPEERSWALSDRLPIPKHPYHLISPEIEEEILSFVARYPELSSKKIVQVLPLVDGKPLVSNKGVQNVLRRHNLSTYEKRLIYSRLHEPFWIPRITLAEIPYIPLKLWRLLFAPFATIPRLLFLVTRGALLFIFLFIVGFIGFQWLQILARAQAGERIGLFFASISLFFGFLFFLYSLKYYFSLILVLTFGQGQGEAGFIKFGKLLSIFGFGRKEKDEKASILATPLDKIKLNRYPFVSIHIPFYNERRVAERILKACAALEYSNFEVIVADDSTDETTQIAKRFENYQAPNSNDQTPIVKVIHRDNREGFKGGALQKALENTDPRAEYILIFDADFIPFPDTIEQFLKYFQLAAGSSRFTVDSSQKGNTVNGEPLTDNSRIAAVQGYQSSFAKATEGQGGTARSNIAAIQGYQWHVLNKSENWITRGVRTEYAGSYVVERTATEVYGGLKMIAGSVYMIRADVLRQYGWGTSITEDFQLTLRLYKDGYKVLYTPYIQAPSECVSTVRRLVRQRMRWAEGHSFNVKKYLLPILFGKKAN